MLKPGEFHLARVVEQHADTGHVVMPAHFTAPSTGLIVRDGAAFAPVPALA